MVLASQAKITELASRLQHRDEEIERLKLALIKLQFGKSSEKLSHEIDQLELRLEELQAEQAQETPLSESVS